MLDSGVLFACGAKQWMLEAVPSMIGTLDLIVWIQKRNALCISSIGCRLGGGGGVVTWVVEGSHYRVPPPTWSQPPYPSCLICYTRDTTLIHARQL